MYDQRTKTGTVEGTGAAINIELGFKPTIVKIFNVDGLATLEWNDAMPAASGVKRVTAGTMTWITSNGVSLYDGVARTTGSGFTIGADADVNASGETIYWEAFGTD